MGTTTNVRLTVAVMLTWAGVVAIDYLADVVGRWSPAARGMIDSTSLVLFLPVAIIAAIWVVRRPPRWPGLDTGRLAALFDAGERPVAVVAVRVAGTQPWRPAFVFVVVGEGVLLGLILLNDGAVVLIFLPMVVLLVPVFLLGIWMSNGRADRKARDGRRRSTAWSLPRSGGRPPYWLLLTDRRLVLAKSDGNGKTDLIWQIPRSELERAAAARRSLRTLDRTIRLHFTDGSSIRLTAPEPEPFLAAVA